MAATSEEQMNLLLSSFDQICESKMGNNPDSRKPKLVSEGTKSILSSSLLNRLKEISGSYDLLIWVIQDFKSGTSEINVFRSKCNVETSRREALEISNKTLKEENERLKKLYTESLNNFVDQLEHRTKCHGLKEELKRINDDNKSKEHEHMNALESFKQKHITKVEELENKIRSLLVEKATNEMVIDRLRQDLTANKLHIQAMSKKLDRVFSEVESKYELEIQDLKDCLLMEQEEKNDISSKLQSLQKELVISRTTVAEKQRDTTSNRQVETLKQKLMKMRKENEILKRKLSSS